MLPIFKQFSFDRDNLPILLGSGLSFLVLFSFALYRLFTGDVNLGLVDLSISLVLLLLFVQALRSRQVEHISMLLVLTYMGGIFAVLYLKGAALLFWVYPAIAATFFLLPVRLALPMNIVFILATAPVFIMKLPMERLLSIYATMILVCVFGFIFSARTENQKKQLTQLATIDSLTLVENRRSLDERLDEVVATQTRIPLPASILVLDLDLFKKINDNYGHIMGDKILIHFADIIKSTIRISDRLYRFGGEEFVVIANNTTIENAGKLAESLRKLVEKDKMLKKYGVTVSIGVAEMMEVDSKNSWLHRGDKALYKAKDSGRNIVCLARPGIRKNSYIYEPFLDFSGETLSVQEEIQSVISLGSYRNEMAK